ncbi:MAG: hypothetical protein WC845_01560 [Candidatus Staskawiczbacteria bacterium]|jgi:hypothetical protein
MKDYEYTNRLYIKRSATGCRAFLWQENFVLKELGLDDFVIECGPARTFTDAAGAFVLPAGVGFVPEINAGITGAK